MNLLQMLLGGMTQQSSISNLTSSSGASNSQIQKLIAAAIPLLLKHLTSNASSQSGIASLLGALSQHRDTASMADQIANADLEDGGKILGHILGDDKEAITSQLAEEAGMDSSQALSALSSMAPALMSGISHATSQDSEVSAEGSDLLSLLMNAK